MTDKWWQSDKDDRHDDELSGLPGGVANALRRKGLDTAQKIRDAGPNELRYVYGLGRVGFKRIKEWLREFDENK